MPLPMNLCSFWKTARVSCWRREGVRTHNKACRERKEPRYAAPLTSSVNGRILALDEAGEWQAFSHSTKVISWSCAALYPQAGGLSLEGLLTSFKS
jgi:hypothetical protein